MSWRRIWLLSAYDLKHSIVGLRGCLFLFPFSFYWFVMFQALKSELSKDLIQTDKGMAIASMTISPEWVQQLFVEHPPGVSLIFYFLLTTLPGFILLASCSHLSVDAGRNSFRYLLTRCSRWEIFIARNLSVFTLVSFAIITLFAYTIWYSFKMDDFSHIETVQYALYGALLCTLYSIPLIGFTSIFSAFFSGTISSFLSASTAMFVISVFQLWNFENYPWVEFLLPSVMKESLLGLGIYDDFSCAMTLIAHSVIFFSLAWWFFSRRDL